MIPLRLLLVFIVLVSLPSLAASKKAAKKRPRAAVKTQSSKSKPRAPATDAAKKETPPLPVVPQAIIVASPIGTVGPPRTMRYRREFQSGFGVFTLVTPGAGFNVQIRFLSDDKEPLYFGVDGQFALFQSSHFLSVLPGAWYDLRLAPSPLLTLSFGIVAGPAFTAHTAVVPGTTYAIFGEMKLAWEIDDLASVHGQFKPGIVGGRFAYAMGILIGFRFR